jgi:hypothetical protein
MKSERLTDADIRAHGWQALVDRLGLTGALRFTMQTESGTGDYARDRHRALGTLSVEQLLARMRSTQTRRRGRTPDRDLRN